MNQEIINWIKENMKTIKTYVIPRVEANILKPGDAATMMQMTGEIMNGIEDDAKNGNNESLKTLYESLANMQEAFANPKALTVEQLKGLEAAISKNTGEIEKMNHIANAFQLDVQNVMPLLEQLRQKQEEVRQSMQSAVDMDFKLYGQTSELTRQAMEAFHFEVTPDRRVIAAKEIAAGKTQEKQPAQPTQPAREEIQKMQEPEAHGKPEASCSQPEQKPQTKQPQEREYLYLPHMGREQFGKTTEYLKKNGGRYDPEKGEKGAWYIPAGKIPLMELLAHHVEPAADKREYLKLPAMGREQFQEALEFLKANGARYDSSREKPAWYVFPGKEGDKIKDYLQQIAKEKDSVLTKLNQNKGKIEKGGQQNQKEKIEAER